MTSSKHYVYLSGCNGQLGNAIASSLRASGCYVIGIDLHRESSNAHLDSYVEASVTDTKSIDEAFLRPCEGIETASSISLINNAGIAVFSPCEDRTYDEFKQVFDVNVWGCINMLNSFVRHFEIKPFADCHNAIRNLSIVNISSIYSLITPNPLIYKDTPRNSSEIYGASKAAINQLTKYWSARYAKSGMRVNAICPGGVFNDKHQGPKFLEAYSDLVPAGRLCFDSEVANLVRYLCLDAPPYLTGQIFSLDGGMTTW